MWIAKSQEELERAPAGAVVVVEYDVKVTRAWLEEKKPKAVITASTGYDNIDCEAAKALGVACYNVPAYGTDTVAEFTLLLMLASLRKLPAILQAVEGVEIDYEALKGRELKGKTVGIVGTGRIGTRVIELLQPFHVRVLAYSRHEKEAVKSLGARYVPLEELLRESDIVSLHVPLTKDTYHLINKERLALMKPRSILINTSRGAVVDTQALAERADVLYAALDVVEGEEWLKREKDIVKGRLPLPKEGLYAEYLRKHPNIILTPHIAYDTEEADRRRWEEALAIARDVEAGREREERVC